MARIEKTVEINAPPEKIWPYIQPEKMVEWYKPFKKIEWTSTEKDREGSTFHIVSEFSGMKAESDAEVTSVIPNKQGVWRTTSGPYTNIASAASVKGMCCSFNFAQSVVSIMRPSAQPVIKIIGRAM